MSEDKSIGPVFTLSESYPYLSDASAEKKAEGVFGEDEAGKTLYAAYKSMLNQLQTTLTFTNYQGRGLRIRFYSHPATEMEEAEWAQRLCSLGYRDALPSPDSPSLAYLNSVERATAAAQTKAGEIFTGVMQKLTSSTWKYH